MLDEAGIFEELINRYCVESRQKVNLNKSYLFFNKNADSDLRASISKLLGIRNNTRLEEYLGIVIKFSKTKRVNFAR